MLLALSGKKGCGKSTTAHILKDVFKNTLGTATWEIKSFGYPIKSILASVCGINWWDLCDQNIKNQFIPDHVAQILSIALGDPAGTKYTYREAQQKIGTDLVRLKVPDFWILSTLVSYHPDKCWIIDDCRFPNEVDAIKKLGGKVIRINPIGIDTTSDSHPSETALDDYTGFDLVIENDHTKGQSHYLNQLSNLYPIIIKMMNNKQ